MHGTIETLVPHLDEARCPIGLWLHDDSRRGIGATPTTRVPHAFTPRSIARSTKWFGPGQPAHPRKVERLIVAPSRYVMASAALERTFSAWSQRAIAPHVDRATLL